MQKPFVVVSGLPDRGKTMLARRLQPVLNLPLIDEDDILNRLFESKGIGNAAWRRALSRESDLILEHQATNTNGAMLVSFWHLPGTPPDAGTPTAWLHAPSHHLVNVHCRANRNWQRAASFTGSAIPATLIANRLTRKSSTSLRTQTRLAPHDIGQRIDVDTSQEPNLEQIARAIRRALGPAP